MGGGGGEGLILKSPDVTTKGAVTDVIKPEPDRLDQVPSPFKNFVPSPGNGAGTKPFVGLSPAGISPLNGWVKSAKPLYDILSPIHFWLFVHQVL